MKPLLYLSAIAFTVIITSCSHPKTNLRKAANAKIILHNNGVKIAYTDNGNVGDTTLLFVHGWAINKSYWAKQVAYYGTRFRVVAIDLPGFGQSGKNRNKWDTQTFAHDVDSVIKQLGLKKVLLVGHSMSGDIALQSAIDNPEKVIGLVGIDNFKNSGAPWTEKSKKEFADAIKQLKQDFKKVAVDWFNQSLFSKTTSTEIRKRILNDVVHANPVIAVACLENGNDFDEIAKLKEAKKKLYLINSDIQPLDSTYLSANKIPYKVFYVPGSGHFPMVEHPAVFNRLMDKVVLDLRASPR